MKNFLKKSVKSVVEFIYKHMEQGSGSMILLTSMTGIILSCLAQSCAIIINKKYTNSQKAFMVPQELTEGLLTVLSMFLITRPTQKLAQRLMRTGKLTTKEIHNYMKNNNLLESRGKKEFDISKEIKNIIDKIKQSDKYIKMNDTEKESLLSEHNDILKKYEVFSDAGSAIATTAATMTASALITPIIRNTVASEVQKKQLNNMQKYNVNTQASIIKSTLFNI